MITSPIGDLDPDRRSPTILLVEDETLLRMAVADQMRRAGFDVIEARNAQEALDVVYSNAPIAVIVADIRLPGALDGTAIIRIARIARPELKVIIASANPPVEAGLAHATYAKPYDVEALVKEIREMIRGAVR